MSEAVAVTGARGFIGSVLCSTLASRGYHVMPLVRPSQASGEFQACDITDFESVSSSLKGADIIVHLAGESNARICSDDFERCYVLNVEGTRNIVRSSKGRKLVFASSGYVYGWPGRKNGICLEDDPLHGSNPYAMTKILAEMICNNYSINYGHTIVIARLFSIIGEKMDRTHLIPSIIKQAIQEHDITIRKLNLVRDFLYVEDAAEAIVSLIANSERGVYNIASGRGTPISSVVAHILEKLGKRQVRDLDVNVQEPPILVGSVRKLRSIGWRAHFTVDTALDRIIDYYRDVVAKTAKV